MVSVNQRTKNLGCSERLLTVAQVAAVLGLSRQEMYRNKSERLNKLVESGVQRVNISTGSRPAWRFRAASLDEAIRRAAETGRPLC